MDDVRIQRTFYYNGIVNLVFGVNLKPYLVVLY